MGLVVEPALIGLITSDIFLIVLVGSVTCEGIVLGLVRIGIVGLIDVVLADVVLGRYCCEDGIGLVGIPIGGY
jgi:hypothetical protein